jgi:hypothetical protein|mmetsp:Transcript_60939/g.178754  ORF Transcript_60939/g.178754 Transcript_60939/m.178754 type:complete len:489 (+) Transcript_60939:71-1537(+)
MSLGHSASEPGLGSRKGSSASLMAAGAAMGGHSGPGMVMTTNLYDKMQGEGKFRDPVPHVRPAGRSIMVPMNDSVERDLASEIYFPLPGTPTQERKFRRISHPPGTIHVHPGLKEQLLPHEEFRYGMRGFKGASVARCMAAGQLMGVAEYKNRVQEQVYESTRREPLGRPTIRGHTIKMLPQGFGNASGEPEDAKKILFPVNMEDNSEEHKEMYKRTHKSYDPGERMTRKYNWPEAALDKGFKFGAQAASGIEGAGAASVLNMDVEDDGTFKKTRLVRKVCEDYRHVAHAKMGEKVHRMQGSEGPPCGPEYRFGIKSTMSDYTAASCIKGYYELEDQLPDQDLGRCTKPGRRNVTTETRAFGTPSVRTDIPAPHPSKRSCADTMSYGDEPSAAAVLNPQRFDNKGVPDREFLIRRPKAEVHALVSSFPQLGDVDFETLWAESLALFDDDEPLCSLDAMLFVHSRNVEGEVANKHANQFAASAPMATAC